MKSYDLVEFGAPLQERERPDLVPKGREAVLRVLRSGVCHSDLHIRAGYFDLGEDGRLDMGARGMQLPMAMGHEVLGEVTACGPEVADPPLGQTMLVHPWIGCGACRACDEDRENDCAKMNALGIVRDGGYASHILVPDVKFLVDVEGLDPSEVTPYACSGITVYNALKKVLPIRPEETLAVIGAGGLGLNAVAIARAMEVPRIVSLDIDDAKLAMAVEMGADATINTATTADPLAALQQVANQKLFAVVDTVGRPETARLAATALVKTGRYCVVGLYGGTLKLPMPWLPQKALSVMGSYVGSANDLRELIGLVRTGKIKLLPVEERPLAEANAALDDLEAGRVTGRIVLTAD